MDFALLLFALYLVGAIGSAIVLEFAFRRDGLDITVRDIALGAIIAITGPVSLGVGIFFFFLHLFKGRGHTVVFRAK